MKTPLSHRRAGAFIRANTAIAAPPHVPGVRLHLADEAHDLWLRTEDELSQIGLPPPFWAFAWAGGQALARHVMDDPCLVEGRAIVDFATGSGLVAIAAMLAGAARASAFDIDPFCGEAVRLNAALNGVAVDFAPEDIIGRAMPADCVVLAGDVFYDAPLAARLKPWFDRLAAGGTPILLGDPGRAYLPRDRLRHLATYRVPVTRALEDADIKRVDVWRYAGQP